VDNSLDKVSGFGKIEYRGGRNQTSSSSNIWEYLTTKSALKGGFLIFADLVAAF